MSTATIKKANPEQTTVDTGEPATKKTGKTERSDRALRAEKNRPGPIKRLSGGLGQIMPHIVRVLGIRLATILVDWLVVLMTTVAALPLLGAWLHQQSGAQAMTLDGTLAFWLVPFGFVTTMIAIVEFYLLRGLWRAGSRKIAMWRNEDAPGEFRTSGPAAIRTTTTAHKKNRNRKGRTK